MYICIYIYGGFSTYHTHAGQCFRSLGANSCTTVAIGALSSRERRGNLTVGSLKPSKRVSFLAAQSEAPLKCHKIINIEHTSV